MSTSRITVKFSVGNSYEIDSNCCSADDLRNVKRSQQTVSFSHKKGDSFRTQAALILDTTNKEGKLQA